MEAMKKKPYVKPGIVFENFETGELTGTPEMVERLLQENMDAVGTGSVTVCLYEDMFCIMRGTR